MAAFQDSGDTGRLSFSSYRSAGLIFISSRSAGLIFISSLSSAAGSAEHLEDW